MTADRQQAAGDRARFRRRLLLGLLIAFHIVICCISLIYLADNDRPVVVHPPTFHLFYDAARLHVAIPIIAAFALVSALFLVSSFSFGYFLGFYCYTMVLGYLWLNCFTDLNYDHRLAGFAAAGAAIAFLLPSLFISSPLRQIYTPSEKAFGHGLDFLLLLGIAIVLACSSYSFHLVAFDNIYDHRDKTELPLVLRYLSPLLSSTLLPFAFACFVTQGKFWRATASLLLLLAVYPVTLSKLALFGPLFLLGMVALSRLFEARVAIILSLTGPIVTGIVLHILAGRQTAYYFSAINFRMVAIPSIAMDLYNDFFARHELTYFCQINLLKRFVACPYQDYLGIVMERAYKIGNFNASLFASEGIASVGPLLSPVAMFACGLVIALGNRLSGGLPAAFVMTSSAILVQVILNVQFPTALFTHGAWLMFLLWYVTPRTIFQQIAGSSTAPAR
jgi:hypothetical protein